MRSNTEVDISVLEDTYEFIQEFEYEAIKECVFTSLSIANLKWWIYSLNENKQHWNYYFPNEDNGDCLMYQMVQFMYQLLDEKLVGTLISIKQFVHYLLQTNQFVYSTWLKEELSHVIRLLVRTFKLVAKECTWDDIIDEKKINPGMINFNIRKWHSHHFQLLYPDISEALLERRLQMVQRSYQVDEFE